MAGTGSVGNEVMEAARRRKRSRPARRLEGGVHCVPHLRRAEVTESRRVVRLKEAGFEKS